MATTQLGAAIQRGVLASRPASGDATKAGQLYFATDTGLFYHDNGTSWAAVHPALIQSLAALASNGLLAQTASGTAAARTLTAGSGKLTVTNGDGVSGNPTVDVGTLAASDVGLGNVQNLKVNLAATAAPAVTDDSGDGYAVGSRWLDTTNDKEYVCLDATAGAAVWTETTATGGGGALTVEEVDGSPTDSAVTKIVFPNGTLGISSHIATYTPAGGGGSGTPATNAAALISAMNLFR